MRHTLLFVALALTIACASVPPAPPAPPQITWEQKLSWIMRLEDQRILRDPNPPPPVVLVPATKTQPAVMALPAPSDLIRLLADPEARARRRAALAVGRVGLSEAVQPLTKLLGDSEFEVRQVAAFALGLIGDPTARPALQAALMDMSPVVQGRAAEALGAIGDKTDATAIATLVRTHIQAGALNGLAADDVTYPPAPPVEAVRLGLNALAKLGVYDALASAVLGPDGQPVSRWWPIAYALQRVGDPKASPALLSLLATDGRYTAAFAAHGLGVAKATAAVGALTRIVQERKAHPAVVIQSLRALAAIGDAKSAPLLLTIVNDVKGDPALRLEAMTALGTLRPDNVVDNLLDLLSEPSAPLRAATMQTLAKVDADTFITALSGLDPDREWSVRAAQATALGGLPAAQAIPRLTVMLQDEDQRVIPSVLNALVALRAPNLEATLLARLKADDLVVRAAAAAGLGELKSAAGAKALIDAYRAWQSDGVYTARAAALGALAKIDVQTAWPVLLEALKDRDWAVRVRAYTLLRDSKAEGLTPDLGRPAPPGRALSDREERWLVAPPFSPHAFIQTARGTIELELAVLDAPQTVANFIDLARRGFFNNVPIHRVVPDFVIQDGDPRGDGEGGPGYTIRDEINERPYLRGTVGMALDWEDTGGSQFFITHSPQPHLEGRYTVFGEVVNGLDVLDRIQPWDVIKQVEILDGL